MVAKLFILENSKNYPFSQGLFTIDECLNDERESQMTNSKIRENYQINSVFTVQAWFS